MAKDLRLVKIPDGEFTYDGDMKMGQLRKLFSAANSGDLDNTMNAYAQIIISWPYDGNPSELESWDDLHKSQFQAISEALMQDLAEQGEE